MPPDYVSGPHVFCTPESHIISEYFVTYRYKHQILLTSLLSRFNFESVRI